MLQVVFDEGLDKTPAFVTGLDELRTLVAEFLPEKVEVQTGIAADSIRNLTRRLQMLHQPLCMDASGFQCKHLVGHVNGS